MSVAAVDVAVVNQPIKPPAPPAAAPVQASAVVPWEKKTNKEKYPWFPEVEIGDRVWHFMGSDSRVPTVGLVTQVGDYAISVSCFPPMQRYPNCFDGCRHKDDPTRKKDDPSGFFTMRVAKNED